MAQVSPNPELWQSNSATQISTRSGTFAGVGTTAPLREFEAANTISGGTFVGVQARELAGGKTVTMGLVSISSSTYPGIWLNQATPSVTNYAFLSDGYSIFNSANTQMSFRVGNANKMVVFASAGLSVGDTFFGTDPGANNLAVQNRIGVGVLAPLSLVHLTAGTATAGTSPLLFTSGTNLTTAVAGSVEFTTDNLFFTITTGAARKAFILDDGARLTSGKIPIATTNGRLIDGPTPLAGTKVYYVSDTSGGAVTRKLTFTDGILTAET